MMLAWLIVLASALSAVQSSCPSGINIELNFNKTEFAGRWYVIGGIRNREEEKDTKCSVWDFSPSATGFNVRSSGLNDAGQTVERHTVITSTKPNIGLFALTVSKRPVKMAVLKTDYKTHACLYSCLSLLGQPSLFAWIISRTPNFDPATIASCQLTMKDNGIWPGQLKGVPHQGCSYSPLRGR